MITTLASNWYVLQDVHDTAERLGLPAGLEMTDVGHQLSEWEPIDRLEHLQLLLAEQPYWGRELRHFNSAPWWYLNEFDLTLTEGASVSIRFSNVDYFCRVWLNGVLLGEHEGYAVPFELDATVVAKPGANRLVVKVWSPWDTTIREDQADRRTFQIERDLVKGSYEHGDTLIARDVNPVGIYGSVTVEVTSDRRFAQRPRIGYRLSEDRKAASVTITGTVTQGEGPVPLLVELRAPEDGRILATATHMVAEAFQVELDDVDVSLWTTWDRGSQPLYRIDLSLGGSETVTRRIGFREVALVRDIGRTEFSINGEPFYIRGTSYFPDVYVSRMHRGRYLRDLLAIRDAGFNLVRVHVHVERPEFYDLCDELGLAVIQDSEYNWTHPGSAEWANRFIQIFRDTILLLDDHPSVVSWICLNEPGVMDDGGRTDGYAMRISPGPQLWEAVSALDPSRPAIKGSFCFDDPDSGDSHNYTGSLDGPAVRYIDIDGTTEKLNTEFGFDAPGAVDNLRTTGRLYQRLKSLVPRIPELQEYQYRLHKYYIEHFRLLKGRPNAGYVQFMFIDLGPNSFYGIYDWWGMPKRVLDALHESNQPVAVMLEQTSRSVTGIRLVNDTPCDFGEIRVIWSAIGANGQAVASGSTTANLGPDSVVGVTDLELAADNGPLDVSLCALNSAGRRITGNVYHDLFGHPGHPVGHPARMSHEFGVRLFNS